MLQTLAIYLLKMIICSALLLSYYWIVLRNKRFHYYNRFYLLLCIVLSIGLPLLNLQWFTFKSNSEKTIHLFNVIYGSGENDVIVNGNSSFINWQQLLTVLLLSVSVCLLFILALRVAKIYRFKKIYPVNKTTEFDFINTDLPQAPFSFLKNIFWRNDISIEEPTGQQILQHELTHVKQKHTFDKLFMQIILSVFWMNPVYWLIRSELYFIHEFIADEKAVNKDASAFAAMLLHAHFGKTIFSPAQSFFYSPIKRRLLMLTTSKEPRLSYARRIMAMPLLALVILLSAFKLQKETAVKTNEKMHSVESVKAPSDTAIFNVALNDSILYVVDEKVIKASELSKFDDPGKIYSINILKGEAAIKKYGDKGKYGVVEITTRENAEQQTKSVGLDDTTPKYEKVFYQVQQEAKFPGGPDAWRKYLEENLNTKILADKKAPPGNYTVVVTFLVNNEGNVSEVKALNDPGYDAAEEAVRVIANSGKWIPAAQNGKPVTYRQKQSITFRIDESKKTPTSFSNNSLSADNNISQDTNFVKASFPGGHDAWEKFLQKNLNSNIPVDKGSPSGTYKVIVSFLVDANGKVSNVKAENNPGYGTAEEAVRVIVNGPDWVPARNNNSPVSSMVKQDITFQVSEQ